MPKKIIIETDNLNEDCQGIEEEIREGYRKIRDHGRRGFEKIRKHIHHQIVKEVKLFTNKKEMVSYVNNLEDIQNVEIFKIEDDLYKVLVTRRKILKECCKDNENK